jgi:hypothetical protein
MKGHTMKISGARDITVQDILSFHNPQLSDGSSANVQIQTVEGSTTGILFHRITASHGGFEWSSGGRGSGPHVFAECKIPAAYAFSGPHMKWTTGTLYDAIYQNQALNVLKHDGSHGFGGANHLAWNCEASSYHFDRPPTAHQWNVGCIGTVNSKEPRTGALPCERLSHGTHVEPGSLYRAQLEERIGRQGALAILGVPYGSNYYWLTPDPELRTALPRTNVTYSIAMNVSPDYAGQTINFSVSGLPAGVTASFNPASRTTAGNTTLTLAASASTLPGNYEVRIIGTGILPIRGGATQSIKRSTWVNLNVQNGSLVFEADQLEIAASSGDSVSTLTETAASGGISEFIGSDAVGDYVKYLVPEVPAGTYNVKIRVKKFTTRGIVQTLLGKVGGSLGSFGAPMDLYTSTSSGSYVEFDLGSNWVVSNSDKYVQFQVTGKNASSSGYTMCFDYIKLTPQ